MIAEEPQPEVDDGGQSASGERNRGRWPSRPDEDPVNGAMEQAATDRRGVPPVAGLRATSA